MKSEIVQALSEQINRELYSSYLYMSMSDWADTNNLPGFAHWLNLQATEENEDAMRFRQYILDRGTRPKLAQIAEPKADFDGILDLFTQVLGHEQLITGHINDLYELAVNHKDYPTQVQLQWYINEQVEEEKTASEILEQLRMVVDHPQGLFALDRQLAGRPAPSGSESE